MIVLTEINDGLVPTDCASRIACFNRVEIVSVFNCQRVPAISLKALWHVFAEGEIGKTLDGHLVVVVEIDQFAEFEMAGQRRGFRQRRLPSDRRQKRSRKRSDR